MSAEFTAGPWRWYPCKDGSFKLAGDYVQIASGPTQVAKVQILSVTEADLQLMVLSPELLRAVQGLIAVIKDGIGDPEDIDIYQQALEIVAKATGKAS